MSDFTVKQEGNTIVLTRKPKANEIPKHKYGDYIVADDLSHNNVDAAILMLKGAIECLQFLKEKKNTSKIVDFHLVIKENSVAYVFEAEEGDENGKTED